MQSTAHSMDLEDFRLVPRMNFATWEMTSPDRSGGAGGIGNELKGLNTAWGGGAATEVLPRRRRCCRCCCGCWRLRTLGERHCVVSTNLFGLTLRVPTDEMTDVEDEGGRTPLEHVVPRLAPPRG